MDILNYKHHRKPFARNLRKNQTNAEQLLWLYLRKRQVLNVRFSRQTPIGPYIVDFYAKEKKLVIEVDGGHHFEDTQRRYDQRRDNYLKSLGLNILRFNNLHVLKSTASVMYSIERKIQDESYEDTEYEYIEL